MDHQDLVVSQQVGKALVLLGEDRHVDGPGLVGSGDKGHRAVVPLGVDRLDVVDKEKDGDRLPRLQTVDHLGVQGRRQSPVLTDRVTGKVDSQVLVLLFQTGGQRKFLAPCDGRLEAGIVLEAAEELVDPRNQLRQGGNHLRPVIAELVKGPGIDQGFDQLRLLPAVIQTVNKVAEVLIRARAPLVDDGGDEVAPDPLDIGQAEVDLPLMEGKGFLTDVDPGPANSHAELAGVGDVLAELGQVGLRPHQGRVEGVRVVTLQVGQLEGQHRVGHCMGPVEAVVGKLVDVVEDLLGPLAGKAIGHRPFEELVPHPGHHRGLLLTHRPPEQVGFPQSKTGHRRRQLHDLFLIDQDSIGWRQNLPQSRIGDLVFFLAVLAGNEVIDIFKRARSVEGVDRDDVLKLVGVEADQDVANPTRLKLEDTVGLPPLEELKSRWVVVGNLVQGKVRVVLVNQLESAGQNRQVLEA